MSKVERWDPVIDGPYSEKAMRKKLEDFGYEVSRYVYSPGTSFPDHTHGVDKIDAVVSGRFRLTVAGKVFVLEPCDYIFVPKGVVHSGEVVGNEPVVSLDATKR